VVTVVAVDDGYDAIVLAGGAGRRMGGIDKPALRVGGATLLDRALVAVAGAARVVVVGPARPVSRAVRFCLEDPPGGGPVAALAAGVPLTGAEVVVVLAADLPRVAPAVPLLLAAVPASGVAVLRDADGRDNYLAAAWRRASLVGALGAATIPEGMSMRELLAGVPVVAVADEDGWARDCDTWDDLASARDDLAPVPEES
jgi:Molybdopterin-guanine dinucleotide biosynthesis protein A